MFDHIMFVLEILLLIVIVVQGEQVKFYERETWKINKERYEERRLWRQAKQKSALKKSEPSSNGAPSMESPQPSTPQSGSLKDGAAESVADPKAISKPV